MNKKVIVIAAAFVLLGAGCAKKVEVKQQTTTEAGQQGESSFKDFLASGKSQKCEVSFKSADTTSSGTMYVASGKMRGDFSATVQEKSVQSHMIVKDQTVYSWVEGLGMSAGFKTSLNTSDANKAQSRSVDVNQKVSYTCQSWTEDDSMFTLPQGVNFNETSAITPNGAAGNSSGQASGSMKAQQCAACNNAGASKAQCLAALGCQ